MEKFNIYNSNESFEVSNIEVEDTETGVIYKTYRKDKLAIILEIEKKIDFKLLNDEFMKSLLKSTDKQVKLNREYSLWKDGRKYLTHCLAVNANTMEIYVIYQALYEDQKYYARPYHLFTSKVDIGREADNLTGQKYRFELIEKKNN